MLNSGRAHRQLLYPCLRALESAVERRGSALSRTPLYFAVVEILKSAYTFFTLKSRRPSTPYRRSHHGQEEEEYFLGEHDGTWRPVVNSQAYWLFAVCAGLLWATHVHVVCHKY